MKTRLITLLSRAVRIDRLLQRASATPATSSLEILRLKALRLAVRRRIRSLSLAGAGQF